MKYSYDSSSFGVSTDKFILSVVRFIIFHILTLCDMLHSLLFNLCTNIQIWISILSKLKLKSGVFYRDNISTRCAILHYLIHTLKMFFAFCCSIFLILSRLIYCFQAPIILLQCLSQRPP
jgi:hypothetical protein